MCTGPTCAQAGHRQYSCGTGYLDSRSVRPLLVNGEWAESHPVELDVGFAPASGVNRRDSGRPAAKGNHGQVDGRMLPLEFREVLRLWLADTQEQIPGVWRVAD